MDAGRAEGASSPEAHGAAAHTPEGRGGRRLAIAVGSHGEGGRGGTGRLLFISSVFFYTLK